MNKYQLNTDEYIIRKINDQYVFLKFENGDSHLLDDVGTLFLDTYLNYLDPVDILCQYFNNIDHKIIKKDFTDFINKLIERKILVIKVELC